MEIRALPETPIRIMPKKFMSLYPLEDRLNEVIKESNFNSKDLQILQVFFNTNRYEELGIELLKLKDQILQVVIPFNWGLFNKLAFNDQQIKFLECLERATIEVAKKYQLDQVLINGIFTCLYKELDQESM